MSNGQKGQRPKEAGYGKDVRRGGVPADAGLVERSILAPRGREESRVGEFGGNSGAAKATEAAVRGAHGAFSGARRRCARENWAPALALGTMMFGVTLLGVTAPWSPFHPGETNVAEAQAGGVAPLAKELAQSDEGVSAEADSGEDGGGFSPSVLPETASSDDGSSESDDGSSESNDGSSEPEESASSGEQPLPEASPGAPLDEEQVEDVQPEETPPEAAPPADEALPESAGAEQYAGAAQYASCEGFADQAGAQGALEAGAVELDGDGDGEACEAFFGTGIYGAEEEIVFAETGGASPMAAYLKGAGWLLAGGGAAGLAAVGTHRTLSKDRA